MELEDSLPCSKQETEINMVECLLSSVRINLFRIVLPEMLRGKEHSSHRWERIKPDRRENK
jgi:hypothetical protein